jgi:hypothetical protein
MVGEHGLELVALPGGTHVYPNRSSALGGGKWQVASGAGDSASDGRQTQSARHQALGAQLQDLQGGPACSSPRVGRSPLCAGTVRHGGERDTQDDSKDNKE